MPPSKFPPDLSRTVTAREESLRASYFGGTSSLPSLVWLRTFGLSLPFVFLLERVKPAPSLTFPPPSTAGFPGWDSREPLPSCSLPIYLSPPTLHPPPRLHTPHSHT